MLHHCRPKLQKFTKVKMTWTLIWIVSDLDGCYKLSFRLGIKCAHRLNRYNKTKAHRAEVEIWMHYLTTEINITASAQMDWVQK